MKFFCQTCLKYWNCQNFFVCLRGGDFISFSVPWMKEKIAGLWFASGISTQADTMSIKLYIIKYPNKQIPSQNNRNNGTMCKIYLKSLINAPERCQLRSFGYLI